MLLTAGGSCLYSKSINSTSSNDALYGWYLSTMSTAYHTAVFDVIWPSTVSDLGVRLFPVWLVSGSADGMHFQPFSSWVMYVNAARGAQNVSSPLLSRAHSFSTASLYLRRRCAGERYRDYRHWNQSERQLAWLHIVDLPHPAQQGGPSCNFSRLYTCLCNYITPQ